MSEIVRHDALLPTPEAGRSFRYPVIEAHEHWGDGYRVVLGLPNGLHASVIRTSFSYGGQAGLYEVAFMHQGELIETPATPDTVQGWLDGDQVDVILDEVAQWNPASVIEP